MCIRDRFVSGLQQRRAAFEGLARSAAPREVAVIGAGLMGSGIAQAAAVGGAEVRLRDVDDAAVGRGLAAVRKLTADAGRKGVIERREVSRVIARVTGTTDLSGFGRADLAIEAVFEDLALKRRVLAELEGAMRADAVIASNTSAIPIAEIARDARHPQRVVGMHFFSPVHRMALVEVVRPAAADPEALGRVVAAAQAMGKTAIVVRDGPGFYTTRVIGAMLGEAALLLNEGAEVAAVDAAMTSFGWPLGPFALIDEVGLAVAHHAGQTGARWAGERPAPNAVQVLADAGRVGKRGGEGFYRYAGKGRAPNRRLPELLAAAGIGTRSAGAADPAALAERLTLLFVNAAARCLDEEILRSPAEGDLGAVLGLGFPPFLGGPFRWADARRLWVAERLRFFADRCGPRYEPAASLEGKTAFYR